MEVESVVPGETEVRELEEVKRLRLCRRMQAVTIELCMAHLALEDPGHMVRNLLDVNLSDRQTESDKLLMPDIPSVTG